jgi:glycosyltransferase involved in cell wall biosynthesis
VAGNAALQIDPHDADAWAQEIAKVLLDEALREKMVSEGLKRAQEFSWERTARETREIYLSLS